MYDFLTLWFYNHVGSFPLFVHHRLVMFLTNMLCKSPLTWVQKISKLFLVQFLISILISRIEPSLIFFNPISIGLVTMVVIYNVKVCGDKKYHRFLPHIHGEAKQTTVKHIYLFPTLTTLLLVSLKLSPSITPKEISLYS